MTEDPDFATSETVETPGRIEVVASPSRAAHLIETRLQEKLSQVDWERAEVLTPIGAWTLTCNGTNGPEGQPTITLKVVFTYHPLQDNQEKALGRVVAALAVGDILERR